MFARIVVDYYGAPTPMNQLASINVPEARMAVIKPYDAEPAAARSRRRSATPTSGVNPSNDGTIIRVVFPQLTEERRRELVKVARHKGEDAKVSIRNIRRNAKDALDKHGQGRRGRRGRGRAGRRRSSTDADRTSTSRQVDELVKHKEAELLEV